MLLDITEAKRTEKALRENEKTLLELTLLLEKESGRKNHRLKK